MADKHVIYGIHVTDRAHNASGVQKILSEYGCNIRTRLGLHEASNNVCSPNGLILLEMVGDEALCGQMAAKVAALAGIEVQSMVFDHP
ncbi:MAG: hypothetical protein KA354_18110 [Phycisphaerae bacterium]|nr:hypothetical protein [Phycisphaerae bacterium]